MVAVLVVVTEGAVKVEGRAEAREVEETAVAELVVAALAAVAAAVADLGAAH